MQQALDIILQNVVYRTENRALLFQKDDQLNNL